MNGNRRRGHTHKAEGSSGPKCLDVHTPVLVGIDRAQNEVLCAGHFLQGFGFAAIDEMVGAEGARFGLFGGRGREGGDLRAEYPGKLNREVAEAADPDHSNPGRRIDSMGPERAVDGDSAAKQRSRELAFERFRNGNDKTRIGADTIRIPSVAMHTRAFRGGAKILHAARTPFTLAAGIGLPAQTHALTDLE